MKIVHFNGYFNEDLAYQENFLTLGQSELGHDVTLLTSRYEMDVKVNSKTRKRPAGESIYKGIKVIRVDHYLEIKHNALVLTKSLLPFFNKLNPDIIFFHDVSPALIYGIIYKLLYPRVRLHIDFHSDAGNARSSFIGPLYHFIWKIFFRIFRKSFERYFCVAPEAIDFVNKYYSIPKKQLIHLPLLGDANILNNYDQTRLEVREKLKLEPDQIALVHTGKLPEGKETHLLLKSFVDIHNENLRLFIIGNITNDFLPVFHKFADKDTRIKYLGWLKPQEMQRLFCGFDLMIQPGSNSHTFIEAICSGLPILLNNTPQARSLTSFGNGEMINSKSKNELISTIKKMIYEENLGRYKYNSMKAAKYYDYRSIAKLSLN